MTPEDIEELFKRTQGVVLPEDGDEDEASLTDDEKNYRIAHLRAILLEAHNAWVSGSDDLDRIAEKLGDGSRHVLWRSPIGSSGILNFFLGILPTPGLRPLLRSHALRLIGNSCADTDENRARVVESGRIHAIIELLYDDSLLPFVIPVLYNVLVDYEPVQLQACEAGLSQRLMEILGGPRLEACRLYVNLICKILALLITQEPEVRNGPPATPLILLSVATNRQHPVDLEDFSGLTAVALAYLTHEVFQTYNLAGLPLLLTAFSMAYTHFDPNQATDPDDAAQLKQVRNAFVPVLADISALPDFVPGSAQGGAGILQHPVFQTLQSWLHGPPAHANLQTAACLALGNLARSDATCVTLVRDAAVHQPLINLLARCTAGETTPNAQLTHAVLSFLKNLAIPSVNKPALGRLLDANMLPKLWSTWGDAQPQTQFAAVSLARLLLVGCPPNARRLCAPLSPDPDSPAHDRSNLHLLTALFERSDAEPTKMEVARAVATVCRILHSTPVAAVLPEEWSSSQNNIHGSKKPKHDHNTTTNNNESGTIFVNTDPSPNFHATSTPGSATALSPTQSLPSPTASQHTQSSTTSSNNSNSNSSSTATTPNNTSRRARFYAAHDLSTPLSFLIKQTRFPALRSEAWFVLALMCRSPDGAVVVQSALQSFEACRALVESITGRDMADGHDLLLAASSSPAADGQEDTPSILPGRGDGATPTTSTAITSGGGGSTSTSASASASAATASLGIEGLGLGGLEPQAVDPAMQANMARIDRENGLCMVAELMRNHADDVLPLRKYIYEQLLLTGGELVLHSRAQGEMDMLGMGLSPSQQQQTPGGGGMGMGGYGPPWNIQ
ncbi:Rap1 GTPase-GDP dissociation stimulator 1 [Cytospora mali]|uniref:Rap1 GTPase-GDP dissociation stimulator 1 n=1 Tax=Cytospora mali TaxID=578113 RepID=A0A194VZE3_CYTMA|nr:Rap1 GTPase-GDP dissociation stimulator 1 [Valsa mali]